MAIDTPTTDTPYSEHILLLQKWLSNSVDTAINKAGNRGWCVLGIKDTLNAATMYKYFSTDSNNAAYQAEYDLKTFTNKPVAYLQSEVDSLNAMSKMYIYRHQPRLKNYRDDFENKAVRTYSSLSLGLAKQTYLESLT